MIELHNNSAQICVNASTTTSKKNETAKKKVRALGGWLGGPTCRIIYSIKFQCVYVLWQKMR